MRRLWSSCLSSTSEPVPATVPPLSRGLITTLPCMVSGSVPQLVRRSDGRDSDDARSHTINVLVPPKYTSRRRSAAGRGARTASVRMPRELGLRYAGAYVRTSTRSAMITGRRIYGIHRRISFDGQRGARVTQRTLGPRASSRTSPPPSLGHAHNCCASATRRGVMRVAASLPALFALPIASRARRCIQHPTPTPRRVGAWGLERFHSPEGPSVVRPSFRTSATRASTRMRTRAALARGS
ncbi:hypothetical protein C8Q77DRAFT_580606 [Trametes polyzona]|nr:hypothetical protein C8Q77DRAFT_580606 [Trametes polyzona]